MCIFAPAARGTVTWRGLASLSAMALRHGWARSFPGGPTRTAASSRPTSLLPLQGPSAAFVFRKAALVEIGDIAPEGTGFRLEVGWRSATLAPLFPVFVGNLTLAPGRIVLDGFYAPPGGGIGVILDRALLNMAARRTAGWFISRVVDAIGE